MDKTLRPERPSISVAPSSRSRARFPWLQMSVVTLSVSIPAGSVSHFRQIATVPVIVATWYPDLRITERV
jgi:hypothetical protein